MNWLRRNAAISRYSCFCEGIIECLPFALGVATWGLVVGVTMAQSQTLSVVQAIAMSLLVTAGAAQIAALPMIATSVPTVIILLAVGCINLRFLVFGYMFRPCFEFMPRHRRMMLSFLIGDSISGIINQRPDHAADPQGFEAFVWGGVSINWICWQAAVISGILLGDTISTVGAMTFAGTMAILCLAMSQIKTRSALIASVMAAFASVAAYALPLRLNILLAIAIAVPVGILTEYIPRTKTPARS